MSKKEIFYQNLNIIGIRFNYEKYNIINRLSIRNSKHTIVQFL